MKTEIGQIGLGLPASLEQRATRIGRLVGESLGRRNDLPAGHVERLRVGPVQVDSRRSDRSIADSIAAAMVKSIRSETARRPAAIADATPINRGPRS